MIKYFCDKCELQAINDLHLKEIKIQTNPTIEVTKLYTTYNLCDQCLRQVVQVIVNQETCPFCGEKIK